MIGNDIVDLRLAEKQSNWKRRGFLDKVFSREEQAVISSSSVPDTLVWRLWSMKESAYKARLRSQKSIQINPRSFNCQILSETEGLVKYGKNRYHTVSQITSDFIHTRASLSKSDLGIFSNVIHMDQCLLQSDQLYKVLISFVAGYRLDLTDLELVKNSLGIPELFSKGKRTQVLCSLSHHGRYGSYLTKI
ncbi:MAG: 4-phosphopantetheinyl transferase family protein [Flavobacteriales bacterium]|nr:4-phosphopantetheinyl transferase family protein [Flavobacteriales bacterium]